MIIELEREREDMYIGCNSRSEEFFKENKFLVDLATISHPRKGEEKIRKSDNNFILIARAHNIYPPGSYITPYLIMFPAYKEHNSHNLKALIYGTTYVVA